MAGPTGRGTVLEPLAISDEWAPCRTTSNILRSALPFCLTSGRLGAQGRTAVSVRPSASASSSTGRGPGGAT